MAYHDDLVTITSLTRAMTTIMCTACYSVGVVFPNGLPVQCPSCNGQGIRMPTVSITLKNCSNRAILKAQFERCDYCGDYYHPLQRGKCCRYQHYQWRSKNPVQPATNFVSSPRPATAKQLFPNVASLPVIDPPRFVPQ